MKRAELPSRLGAVLVAMPTRHRISRLALVVLAVGSLAWMVATGTAPVLLLIAAGVAAAGLVGATVEIALLVRDANFTQERR
ncbi:hypothetical protein [Nocardiopsis sp. NRRL B-16309]|uniref:hypothetical protein n=1 Tax=Nocardiopsis sp. NRRL B-16309 TaxID=1519494 RepID=UPI0006AE7BF1|nr:hypothetical protein [Nocardiopsis sp. NRRL B-16309]KOX11845.1 hypothetical protein ADL05_23080 [Nocardiopsis sp. NRRL B-16309]